MKIQNCKILESKANFLVTETTTTIQLTLMNAKEKYEMNFSAEKTETKKLCEVVGVNNSSELEEKIIREVRNKNNLLIGFGDPIKDEFFLLDFPYECYTEEELKERNF